MRGSVCAERVDDVLVLDAIVAVGGSVAVVEPELGVPEELDGLEAGEDEVGVDLGVCELEEP